MARLEAELSSTSLSENNQTTILVMSSLLLSAGVGVVLQLLMSWALGPGWGASLGLMAVLSGAFWSLASRADGNGSGSHKPEGPDKGAAEAFVMNDGEVLEEVMKTDAKLAEEAESLARNAPEALEALNERAAARATYCCHKTHH